MCLVLCLLLFVYTRTSREKINIPSSSETVYWPLFLAAVVCLFVGWFVWKNSLFGSMESHSNTYEVYAVVHVCAYIHFSMQGTRADCILSHIGYKNSNCLEGGTFCFKLPPSLLVATFVCDRNDVAKVRQREIRVQIWERKRERENLGKCLFSRTIGKVVQTGIPTEHFMISKPQNWSIVEYYSVQKSLLTDFEAHKLWNAR